MYMIIHLSQNFDLQPYFVEWLWYLKVIDEAMLSFFEEISLRFAFSEKIFD